MRGCTLVKTTTQEALANFGSGLWVPVDDLTPTGSVTVYHTVIKDRFRVLLTDYQHVPEEAAND